MHNVNAANCLLKFVGGSTYAKLVTLNSGRLMVDVQMYIPETQGNLNEQANKQDYISKVLAEISLTHKLKEWMTRNLEPMWDGRSLGHY